MRWKAFLASVAYQVLNGHSFFSKSEKNYASQDPIISTANQETSLGNTAYDGIQPYHFEIEDSQSCANETFGEISMTI